MRNRAENLSTRGWMAFNARLVMVMALMMLAASVFTLPFPFVRPMWIGEIWGYYGLLNSVCFIAISQGLSRFSMSAAVSGMAITLYDQWLTWHAFLLRFNAGELDGDSLLYMGISLLVGGVLIMLLLSSMRASYLHIQHHRGEKENQVQKARKVLILTSVMSVLYIGLILVAGKAAHLDPPVAYATLRILGVPACLLAGARIGGLLQTGFENGGMDPSTIARIIFHALFFAWILWSIHALIPLQQIMQKF